MTEVETYPYEKLSPQELDNLAQKECGPDYCKEDRLEHDIDICLKK